MAQPNPYDDDAVFDVKLMRPVTYRGVPLLPLNIHEMTGRALNAILAEEGDDAVDTAVRR